MFFQTHSFDVFSYHSSPRGPVKLVSKHALTHRSHYLRDYLNTTGNAVFFSLQEDGFQSQNESCFNQKDIFFFKGKGDKRRMFCDEHSIFLKAQTFCPELLHTCSRV